MISDGNFLPSSDRASIEENHSLDSELNLNENVGIVPSNNPLAIYDTQTTTILIQIPNILWLNLMQV